MDTTSYQNPLTSRYTSNEMSYLFSEQNKITIWRRLWITLAEKCHHLGVACIDTNTISEMKEMCNVIDYSRIRELEKLYRHDVMANVYAFGEVAPLASKIIHLGATSCYVTDNGDLIIYRDALGLILKKLRGVIDSLSSFAKRYSGLPTLAYTHFQAAQLTTVGKRACLWLQDLQTDYEQLKAILEGMKFRGAKGTTGTQASFLELLGSHTKVQELDRQITEAHGFKWSYHITGQTYPRKFDTILMNGLSLLGGTCHKFATDIRLLAHLKEIDEPFENDQIGSSAMAYKRNPMRSERICGLARYLMSLAVNSQQTASIQWFERTLDDSSNRRISIPQAFLTADVLLNLMHNVIDGLVVYPDVIRRNVLQELPFMITENIILHMTKSGSDRQECHERILKLSQLAHAQIKSGGENNLVQLIQNDDYFKPVHQLITHDFLNPNLYIGLSIEQVEEYTNYINTINNNDNTQPAQDFFQKIEV